MNTSSQTVLITGTGVSQPTAATDIQPPLASSDEPPDVYETFASDAAVAPQAASKFNLGTEVQAFFAAIRKSLGLKQDISLPDPALMLTHEALGVERSSKATIADRGKKLSAAIQVGSNNAAQLFSVAGPAATDVVQGSAYNSYLMSTLAALATQDPSRIRDMITDNRDGTFGVRLYPYDPNTGAPSAEPQVVTVDADLARIRGTTDEVYAQAMDSDGDGREELWVALIEKAFATFNDQHGYFGFVGEKGYEAIGYDAHDTGNPEDGYALNAYEILTGEKGTYADVEDLQDAELLELLRRSTSGYWVTAGTHAAPEGAETSLIGDGVLGGHNYAVLGVIEGKSKPGVVLYDPYGVVEPGFNIDDKTSWGDGVFALSLDDFRKYFLSIDHSVEPYNRLYKQLSANLYKPGNAKG